MAVRGYLPPNSAAFGLPGEPLGITRATTSLINNLSCAPSSRLVDVEKGFRNTSRSHCRRHMGRKGDELPGYDVSSRKAGSNPGSLRPAALGQSSPAKLSSSLCVASFRSRHSAQMVSVMSFTKGETKRHAIFILTAYSPGQGSAFGMEAPLLILYLRQLWLTR